MSSTISFDTHRFVQRLTGRGFTEAQAEALAHEQVHLLEANLATKDYLAVVKADLELKIEQFKSSILMWMLGALTAHLAVVAALFQYLR